METEILLYLKKKRKEKNITQVDAAKALGMKTNTFGDLENGKTRIRLVDFLELCKLLDVDPISLLHKSDEVIVSMTSDQVKAIEELAAKLETLKIKK